MSLVLSDVTKTYEMNSHGVKALRGVSFDLDIRTCRIIESTRLPRVADWDQYYYRFLADYDMTVTVDGRKETVAGDMLHEYISL